MLLPKYHNFDRFFHLHGFRYKKKTYLSVFFPLLTNQPDFTVIGVYGYTQLYITNMPQKFNQILNIR